MRVLAYAFLILSTLSTQVRSEGFLPCSHLHLLTPAHSELRSDRIRAIIGRVIQKARYPLNGFELCQIDWFVPTMVVTAIEPRAVYKILLPTYMERMSESEIEGLAAHEIGHIPLMSTMMNRGVRLEVATDTQAALWVGKDTVIAGLRALIRYIDYFPEEDHASVIEELEFRVHTLRNRDISQR